MSKSLPFVASLGIVALSIVGCSSDLEVSGRVTFNGKPVESGTITFEPEDRSGPTKSEVVTNGAYRLAGVKRVTPGAKTVRIQAFGPTGRKVSDISPP